MKKFVLMVVMILCTLNSAYAMVPINDANMKDAQNFGVSQKNISSDKMLARWTIKDRKKTNKYGNNERAIVYTPYLAVAINAQNAAKTGKAVNFAESLSLAKEYDGVLSVGLVLNSTFKVEPKFLKIKLYQVDDVYEPYATTLEKATITTVHMTKDELAGKKTTSLSAEQKAKLAAVKKDVEAKSKAAVKGSAAPKLPTVSKVPTPAAKSESVAVKVWNLQYFTYFDLSAFHADRHVVLRVSDQAGGDREFVLDLPNLK